MLAAPVVLEYVTDYQTTAVGILILLGCAAASVVLPPVGYALAAGEAAALFGGVAAFATSIKVTYGKLAQQSTCPAWLAVVHNHKLTSTCPVVFPGLQACC